nr:hypothetical protein [uncultured Oscillibacter sp.]
MYREYSRRLGQLLSGIVVTAVGIVMTLQANVGLEPWSVLQQGLTLTFGITFGLASILVGTTVILIAVLCGERIGAGTFINIILCGVFMDGLLALGWLPKMTGLASGVVMLLAGLEVLALGTWMYMRSALGSGPRDALMVALARKTGRSVGLCRASVELAVFLAGWFLGGQVGIGTLISALGLGMLFNLNFALLHFDAAALHQEDIMETLRRLSRQRQESQR